MDMKTPSKYDLRVGQYLQVRDAIRELKERHTAELKPLNDLKNRLSSWLISHLEADGAKSVRTDYGTVYSTTKWSASLSDPKAFMDYVIENNRFELLDRKANVTAVRTYTEENGGEPPGARLTQEIEIGVRAGKNHTDNGDE